MIRIAGVNLPVTKKIYVALSYIYGIGRKMGYDICNKVGVDPEKKASALSEDEVTKIRKYIEDNCIVEGNLRGSIVSNIKFLIGIGCYRGIRHRLGLPVRGQRTKTNARTRKGKKSTPVAGKKKVAK